MGKEKDELDYEPKTPVIKPEHPRSPEDPNEVLLDDFEISEDETNEFE